MWKLLCKRAEVSPVTIELLRKFTHIHLLSRHWRNILWTSPMIAVSNAWVARTLKSKIYTWRKGNFRPCLKFIRQLLDIYGLLWRNRKLYITILYWITRNDKLHWARHWIQLLKQFPFKRRLCAWESSLPKYAFHRKFSFHSRSFVSLCLCSG